MKKIKILQEKQSNGMWGTPRNCFSLDMPHIFDKRKYLIWCAWICATNEKFKTPFSIRNFGDGHDVVTLNIQDSNSNSGFKTYFMLYKDYEVIDDTLYEFENEKEHKIFLRKSKIKQLNEGILQ